MSARSLSLLVLAVAVFLFVASPVSAQVLLDLHAPLFAISDSELVSHSLTSPDHAPAPPAFSVSPACIPAATAPVSSSGSIAFVVPAVSLELPLSRANARFTPLSPCSNSFAAAQPQSALLMLPSNSCPAPTKIDLVSACFVPPPPPFSNWSTALASLPASSIQPTFRAPQEKFHWGPALWQSFAFLVVSHAFRLANDGGARYLLLHRPFWHDYWASANNFDMSRWGDGDSFLVNYIGHPMEGAVAGDIFLNNDPQGRSARFGKSKAYWYSRLKAMAWATGFEAYFEIGPIFSEAAIGNEGGYTYVPGCGLYPCNKYPGKHFKPPTNNTGWVDFVITPVVGLGWIVMEDAIETEIVDRLANGSPSLTYKILRGSLAPSHTFANMFAGKKPWYRYPTEEVNAAFGSPVRPVPERPKWKDEPRFSTGLQFISMDLPLDREGCGNCKQYTPGGGADFTYRIAQFAYLDAAFNYFPGSGSHGAAQEYLAGLKLGYTGHSWGIYSNVRPGMIHYDKALVPGSSTDYESVARFVLDLGGTVEYYTSRNSTLRFNLGTTLVHYLQSYPDPKQPPVSVISDQYYSFQGSVYVASSYVYRF
jgi:hypothetical protein